MGHVIVLEPEEKLYTQILELKTRADELVGDQLYLQDPPHLTLYVARLEDDISTWTGSLKKLIQNPGDLKVTIDRWLYYENDGVTGLNTICANVSHDNTDQIKELQRQVATTLRDYRTRPHILRYDKLITQYDAEEPAGFGLTMRNNLARYGFPFVEGWHPHASIASFEEDAFKTVKAEFDPDGNGLGKCPVGTFGFTHLAVYHLNEDTEELKLLEKFPLGN